MTKALAMLAMATPAAASNIILESFSDPKHTWTQSNDPVMGGQSTGTFEITNGVGVFDGNVVDVPSLSAPGFIKVESDRREPTVPFPDITSCDSFYMRVKSDTEYEGFRFSVDNVKVPGGFFLYGHKAPVFGANLEVGSITTVTFPFDSFSNYWDAATGDIIETCEDNAELCLNDEILTNIGTIAIWGEGVGGLVHLEVEEIGASGCSDGDAPPVFAEVANLATFAGVENISTHEFYTLNDPVMGGQSTSTYVLDSANAVMKLSGNVAIVPSLSAPGFVVLQSTNPRNEQFADISAATHLLLRVKSNIAYGGFKVSFAANTLNWQFASFKANFELLSNGEFEDVAIPFSAFSNEWSSATGDSTCPDDKDCTPNASDLASITNVGFWLEGSEGDFDVELESIRAGFLAETAVVRRNLRGN